MGAEPRASGGAPPPRGGAPRGRGDRIHTKCLFAGVIGGRAAPKLNMHEKNIGHHPSKMLSRVVGW